MKMIEKLTPEQEAKIPVYLNKYYDKVYKNQPFDKALFTQSIQYIYRCFKHKNPDIWVCDSPLQAQLIANLIKNKNMANLRDNLGANLWANLGANLRANLRDNLWANLGANLEANLWDNLRANLRDNLWANLGANLGANLWDNLWANLRANLGANLGAQKIEYVPFAYYGNISDYSWTCLYEFINNELIPGYKYELWDKWKNLINSNFYDMIQFDSLVIAVKMPISVKVDDRRRLHCADGYAVEFADGYAVCAWHGIIVDERIILDPEHITPELISKEQNAEIRRCMVEKYGRDRFLKLSTKVHSDEWGELYRNESIRDVNGDAYCFVKVVNSTPEPDGTFKDYVLRVNPKCKTAYEAVASTFPRIPNFSPAVET